MAALPALANNADVVVAVPPQVVWGTGGQQQATAGNCISCCVYQNRNYSEGAVIKTEGVLLQCTADPKRLSTNNLVWRIIKQ